MSVVFRAELLPTVTGYRIHSSSAGELLSCADSLTALTNDAAAADGLTECLAVLPLAAFAWECRPIKASELAAPIEMVAIDSPGLAQTEADAAPFAAHLARAQGADVVTFDNLGGDGKPLHACREAAGAR